MTTPDPNEPKAALHRYLQSAREALVWKLEGLSEREARWPRTPTGTNLLGLVKHAAACEIGYFGDTFGRPWPDPDEVAWIDDVDTDPNADLYAKADESLEGIVELYRRVWEFADETITTLPLDAHGRVPWWPDDHADVTLHRILTHMLAELARHAGHADIIRELHDHAVGLSQRNTNIPGFAEDDWAAYTAKLKGIAEQFAG
jgi:uncharacterized damage-inducible protein DinB